MRLVESLTSLVPRADRVDEKSSFDNIDSITISGKVKLWGSTLSVPSEVCFSCESE